MSTISSISNSYDQSVLLNSLNSSSSTSGTSSSSSALTKLANNTLKSSLSESTISYLMGIKDSANAMVSTMSKISGNNTAFNKLNPTSSDTEVLSISGSAPAKSMSVEVSSLATKQTNKGTALEAGGKDISAGSYSLSVEYGNGNTRNFNISVKAGDTNEDIQRNIAKTINSASQAGITASVATNDDGTTSLNISSKNTGSNSSFTFSGGLAEELGMNQVTQEASNARYFVDGKEHFSQSNTITLGIGTTATLKSTSSSAITVSSAKDSDGMKDAIKEMVNSYNSLLEAAKSDNNRGATNLQSKLKSLVSTYASSLEKLGIKTDNDGKLTIDDKALSAAAEDGSLEIFIKTSSDGKSNYGFGNRLNKLASEVSKDPMQYYKEESKGKKTDGNKEREFTFSDFSSSQLRQLVKYDSIGLLFNYMQ